MQTYSNLKQFNADSKADPSTTTIMHIKPTELTDLHTARLLLWLIANSKLTRQHIKQTPKGTITELSLCFA